jgi:hypothetical protein
MAISPLNYWPFDFEIRSILPSDSTSERLLDDIGGNLAVIKPTDAKQSALLAIAQQKHQKIVEQPGHRRTCRRHGPHGDHCHARRMAGPDIYQLRLSCAAKQSRRDHIRARPFLISNWLYLILGMDSPFSGPIRMQCAASIGIGADAALTTRCA